MSRLASWLRSWTASLLRRRRVERSLDDELRFHLEAHAADLMSRGVPPAAAMRRARLDFGGVEGTKEACREALGLRLLDGLARDLRFGARMLRKEPGLAAIAALTLAVGIGANAAVFAAVDALLLRPLPVADLDRVVFGITMRQGFDPFGMSVMEFAAIRERNHVFARTSIGEQRSFNLSPGDGSLPERVPGAAIEADFLATLGVTPQLGRSFTAAEDGRGGAAIALIGDGLWHRRYGGNRNVIGQTLDLDGQSTTIAGILPPAFDYPNQAEIWVPLRTPLHGLPLAEAAAHRFGLVGRLLPGKTVRQADAELHAIARQLAAEYPSIRQGWTIQGVPFRRALFWDLDGRTERSLLAVTGAVGLLLLICCANVAGLLLARGVGRQCEIAMRRALGASRGRIARQLVIESLLLSIVGGTAGALLAWAALPVLRALNPLDTLAFSDLLRSARVDGRVLAFLAAVTSLAGIASGLAPAWTAIAGSGGRGGSGSGAMTAIAATLRDGARGSGTSAGRRRCLGALVVAEVAIAVALLAGGGLMVQSFQRLHRLDLGFQPRRLLTLHMELAPHRYATFPQRITLVDEVLRNVRRLPGVAAAGISDSAPLTTFNMTDAHYIVEGNPPARLGDLPITAHRLVSAGYLETLGVSLVAGRLLDPRDRDGSLPVVVISEELARQGWPGKDPLGRRIQRVRPGQSGFPWMTVVGIVKDVKEDRDNFRRVRAVWYLPFAQQPNEYPLDLVVQASVDPASLTPAIRRAVLAVDPQQPLSNATTLPQLLATVLAADRFSAILMATLAVAGLLLAVIGLYGVMAYSVRRQTQEIGLRVALGARPTAILAMVLGRGLRLTAAGLLLGLAGAEAAATLLAGGLYGVGAHDPLTFAAAALAVAAVAALAAWWPARRAMRVDPLVALRAD